MRLLVLIILTAAFGWSAFWFTGKTIRETALKTWFMERNESGWIVENTLSLRGFPNRYDAIIKDIKIKDPKTGWAWSTDRLEILQLSYQPNHFIVLWPKYQKINTPSQKLLIDSDELRSSVVFKPNSANLLKRAAISAEILTLSSNEKWDITFKNLVLALHKSSKGENIYDFGLDTKGFYLPQSFMDKIDSEEIMPKYFKSIHLDTNLQFSKDLYQKSFKLIALVVYTWSNNFNLESIELMYTLPQTQYKMTDKLLQLKAFEWIESQENKQPMYTEYFRLLFQIDF